MKKLAVLLATLLVSTQALAFNAQTLRYYFPDNKVLATPGTTAKPADTLTMGLGLNFAYRPLEFGNTATGRTGGIIDRVFTMDYMASYSFSDRFMLGLTIPTHFGKNLVNINSTNFETPFNLGDMMLAGKVNILHPYDTSHGYGVAVVPFITFPTGRSSDFVGDSSVTGGFLVSGDIDLNGHYLVANLGLRLREQENYLNLAIAHEFLYSLGYHHMIAEDYDVDGFAEVSGATVMKDFWAKSNSSPIEARVGVGKKLLEDKNLRVTVTNGVGLTKGYGAPDYRAVVKVSYDHVMPKTKTVEVVKVVEKPVPYRIRRIEKELKELTIYYPTDGDQVDPYYDQKIKGIAGILKSNPDLSPLYIVGYTDDVASASYNQQLSERRAKKAASSIKEHGLDDRMIVWVGLGEAYPVVPNTSDANRALNRRTLFTFVKPEALKEKYSTFGGVVGYNTVNGKKNDSYTEVLKSYEARQGEETVADENLVVWTYKDKSQLKVKRDGTNVIQDKPGAQPKEYKRSVRKKKYYEEENVPVEDESEVKKTKHRKSKKDDSPLYEEF